MNTDNEMWWSVWWPWALLWGATVLALLLAAAILAVHWRSSRKKRAPRHANDFCLYIDDDLVMDLYLRHQYEPALQRQVEEKISSGNALTAAAQFVGLHTGAKRQVNTEILRKYIEQAEPIKVINTILNALENDGAIIYIDLEKQSVLSNKDSHQLLGEDGGGPGQRAVRASELGADFVSVTGQYRCESPKDSSPTVFSAPYGASDQADDGPRVRVTCITARLRRDVHEHEHEFRASCLGRVQPWNAESGELLIDPIAIFQ